MSSVPSPLPTPQSPPHVLPGAQLRAAREQAQIPLEDVARALNLDRRTIVALESDDYTTLNVPIFVHGYLRAYARLVNLDPAPLLAAYAATAPAEPPIREVGNARRAARARARSIPWSYYVGALAIAVALVVAWQVQDTSPFASSPALTTAASSALPPLPASESSPAPAATPDAAAPVSTAYPALRLHFSQPSFVEVRDALGNPLLQGMYNAGEVQTVQAVPPLKVTIANAVGVRVDYNGSPIDLTPYRRGAMAALDVGVSAPAVAAPVAPEEP